MRLPLAIGVLLVAVTAGAVAVAVWASVADAPWEDNEGGSEIASLLCEDALERRKAVEDALQEPVLEAQVPLSSFRAGNGYEPLRDEVMRLESKLRDIERDIQQLCE